MPRKPKDSVEEPAGPREVAADYFDDDWVEISPQHDLIAATARALLETAERLGYDPARAVHGISGGFRVPRAVADAVTFPTAPLITGPEFVPTPLAALDRGAAPDPEPSETTDASA